MYTVLILKDFINEWIKLSGSTTSNDTVDNNITILDYGHFFVFSVINKIINSLSDYIQIQLYIYTYIFLLYSFPSRASF